jgi:hypothetical protein
MKTKTKTKKNIFESIPVTVYFSAKSVKPKNTLSKVKKIIPKNKTYVVTGYRWGLRDNHSHVVGICSSLKLAKIMAKDYVSYRGGKYGAEVVEGIIDQHNPENMRVCKQVFYVECPYYGAAGRFIQSMQPADNNKDKWNEESEDPFIKVCKDVMKTIEDIEFYSGDSNTEELHKQCIEKLKPFLITFVRHQ